MKALSIRAPWWWLILHAGKDIENRDWYTSYRGPILIHASKWYNAEDVYDDWHYGMGLSLVPRERLPSVTLGDLRGLGGHIVGQVEIVDCVRDSASPWFFGKFGFVLRNPVAFDNPYAIKGALGLFDVSEQGEQRDE